MSGEGPAITKYEVIAFHRAHPSASIAKAAAALGCRTQYISTTARRNGLKFPRETVRKPRKSLCVPRNELTAVMLRDGLFYDPKSGGFYWKAPRSKVVVGSEAGTLQSGYRMIRFCGVDYHAHRLAWLYMFGCWPSGDVDHINGNRLDNRIANLRSATRSQNNANAGLSSRNTSGFKGVSLHKKTNRWMAYIKVDGVRKYLGMHSTPEAAASAYDRAAINYFGEFARTNKKILESVQSHDAAVVSEPAESSSGAISATHEAGPQIPAVPGGEPSTPSPDADGAKMDGVGALPGQSDDKSESHIVQSGQAVTFINPKCLKPKTCSSAHSETACFDCVMAWAERPKEEQVRLWAEANGAAA